MRIDADQSCLFNCIKNEIYYVSCVLCFAIHKSQTSIFIRLSKISFDRQSKVYVNSENVIEKIVFISINFQLTSEWIGYGWYVGTCQL